MIISISCIQLFVTLWTVALQASLSMGFSNQEYWSGLPCPPPGNLPDPGIEPASLMSLASGKEPTYQCKKQEAQVRSLGWEDSLEEGMATHSSILAWRIPWTEEPGRPHSIGSYRVRHHWSDLACMHLTTLEAENRASIHLIASSGYAIWLWLLLHMNLFGVAVVFGLTNFVLCGFSLVAASIYSLVVISHCSGLSCCRAWALGCSGSVVVAHWLSCSAACGIFPEQGLNSCPLNSLGGRYWTTGPSGKSPLYFIIIRHNGAFLMAQHWRIRLPMQETWVWSLGWEDSLEKEEATNTSTLAWKTPWTEELGWLQSIGSQRVTHNLATKQQQYAT